MRRHVLVVADEVDYEPGLGAWCLGREARTIGLLFGDVATPAYALRLGELHIAAESSGGELAVMTVGPGKQDERQVSYIRDLLAMNVAGLIVCTGGLPSELLRGGQARRTPPRNTSAQPRSSSAAARSTSLPRWHSGGMRKGPRHP